MKYAISLMSLYLFVATYVVAAPTEPSKKIQSKLEQLTKKSWFSGAKDCSVDNNKAIEVYQKNANSYILRQNKCLHYEAPFIYLLLGSEKALLVDTGATKSAKDFPLAQTIQAILASKAQASKKPLELLVAHSHSHSDHIAADSQFTDIAKVISANNLAEVTKTFKLSQWPNNLANFDLGDRKITVIPSPGHQKEAISFYDPQTQWLLTGDTFYPGRLYTRQWQAYVKTIARLVEFSTSHKISAILGAHIEMSAQNGVDYPTGSKYQPNEASLVLTVEDLKTLNQQLVKLGNEAKRVKLDKFIIYPVD